MTYLPLFDKDCRFFLAITSFILTVLLGWDAVINKDAVLYLTQAWLIGEGDWVRAASVYPWPGYSALIACIQALGPSLEHAAVLINASFYALLVAGFVSVIKQMGGNNAIQWLAGITVLIYPIINGYRESIIRDVGLWGMMFWGIYALVRFHEKRQWRDVCLWTLTMGIAFMFRVEAIVLIGLAPFGLLLIKPRRSVWDMLHFQSVFLVAMFSALIFIMITGKVAWLSRLHELPQYLVMLRDVGDDYMNRAHQITTVFSSELERKYGAIALFGASLAIIVFIWVKVVTPFYLALAGLAVSQHLMGDSLAKRYILMFIGISATIVIMFFLKRYFLTSRYLVMLSLLCITPVPFAIHAIANARGNGTWMGKQFVFPLMVLILVGMAISGVIQLGDKKIYLRDAGEWVHQHVRPDTQIYISDTRVAYYAKRFDVLLKKPKISLDEAIKGGFTTEKIVVVYHDDRTSNVNAYLAQLDDRYEQIPFNDSTGRGVMVVIKKQ